PRRWRGSGRVAKTSWRESGAAMPDLRGRPTAKRPGAWHTWTTEPLTRPELHGPEAATCGFAPGTFGLSPIFSPLFPRLRNFFNFPSHSLFPVGEEPIMRVVLPLPRSRGRLLSARAADRTAGSSDNPRISEQDVEAIARREPRRTRGAPETRSLVFSPRANAS